MKSILKKIMLILAILLLLFSINTKVFAWSEIISDGKSFLEQAKPSETGLDVGALQTASGYLYNILLAAGVVIAVIVATVLGIQFMTGGAEGQAKVKEMMIPFVIGCVIVFGGFGFWKIAITVGESLEDAGGQIYTEDQDYIEEDEGQIENEDYYIVDTGEYCKNCNEELNRRELNTGTGLCNTCSRETEQQDDYTVDIGLYCSNCGIELDPSKISKLNSGTGLCLQCSNDT